MKDTYIVIAENSKWIEVEAYSAEMAMRSQSPWFGTTKKFVVINKRTKEAVCFF